MALRKLFVALFTILLFIMGLPMAKGSVSHSAREPVPLPIWRDEIVAPGVDFYSLSMPSLALDPDGYPHLVYGQNHLFHTWFDGSSWRTETIDATHAWRRESMLAIDGLGTIIIIDIKNDRGFMRTLQAGESWQTTQLPSLISETAVYLTFTLDSSGQPHIAAGPAYYDNKSFFIYAHLTPAGWTMETVNTGSSVDGPLSIALDSKDRPVILYEQHDKSSSEDELWIARRSGDSWQHDQVAAGCLIAGNSLAVDAQDKTHAVFSDHCDGELTYALERDHGWDTILVTNDGYYPSLALDNAGRPHVVYGSDQGQVYATLTGAVWNRSVVQGGEYAGRYNTLVLDKAGTAHIASLMTNLHYAANGSGQWQVSTPARQETIGRQNALALDSANGAHALYHKAESQELFWGFGNANDWEADLVAEGSSTGLEVAVAVDTQDRPHIAYIDGDKNKLMVGIRQAGLWSQEQISAGGRQLSLAVGSDDRPQLIMIQNEALNYWTLQGNDWVSETVGEAGSRIWAAQLALDSQNRPHIIYTGSKGSIYAVRHSTANWIPETLPFETIEDLAFGQDDKPYFLYSETRYEYYGRYPFIFVSLWYAERDGNGWLVEPLWEDEFWDVTASLAVDTSDRVHVALRSTYDDYYYLLRGESGAWRSESVARPGPGDISLALGQDNQPRLLTHDGSSLILSTREILWLDQFSIMPIIAR